MRETVVQREGTLHDTAGAVEGAGSQVWLSAVSQPDLSA